MLVYISVYGVAAVLMFLGANLLGEPIRLIPPEVLPAPLPASRWGSFLLFCGALLAALALLSHAYPGLTGALVPLRGLDCTAVALYGLWLVFGRKVDYSPAAPAPEAHGHAHGH